jgi:hypothetical protein
MLRPESMGGPGNGPGNEGPILRPVPRAEQAPRAAPVQPAPPRSAPIAESSAPESKAAAKPAPAHRPAPKKVDPQEKKGHPDPRER